ncbi:MAG: methyltransferase domain-containing protein [Thermomicrobiales bacterium]
MTIPGLAFSDRLPPAHPGQPSSILLIGGDAGLANSLRRAGYMVSCHALDMGPMAQRPGVPFTAPVVAWPFPDQTFAAVVLLDELALVVQEEEALAEAARVLLPGGILLLRVPASGRLAWLDGYNAYRYLRDISHRGQPLAETRGVGWRRHYRRADIRDLLRPHFRMRRLRGFGLGLSDASRLGLNLFWRWLLRSPRGDAAIERIPRRLARIEGNVSVFGRGYWLVAVAEKQSDWRVHP